MTCSLLWAPKVAWGVSQKMYPLNLAGKWIKWLVLTWKRKVKYAQHCACTDVASNRAVSVYKDLWTENDGRQKDKIKSKFFRWTVYNTGLLTFPQTVEKESLKQKDWKEILLYADNPQHVDSVWFPWIVTVGLKFSMTTVQKIWGSDFVDADFRAWDDPTEKNREWRIRTEPNCLQHCVYASCGWRVNSKFSFYISFRPLGTRRSFESRSRHKHGPLGAIILWREFSY
jgi:hypothetical protein